MTHENITPEANAAEPDADAWGGWDAAEPGTDTPSVPPVAAPAVQVSARADYKFTLGLRVGSPPTLTIRAESAVELNQAFTELEMHGVWANIAAHQQTIQAHANVGAGLGPVTPVLNPVQQGFQSQAAQAPQWGPPNGVGGQPGTAPAAWQNAGAPAPQQGWGQGQAAPQQQMQGSQQGPKPRPQWPSVFKIKVPYDSKDQFKDFRNQNAQILRGKVAWAGGGDYWIHGDVVGGFQQYNPQPA